MNNNNLDPIQKKKFINLEFIIIIIIIIIILAKNNNNIDSKVTLHKYVIIVDTVFHLPQVT